MINKRGIIKREIIKNLPKPPSPLTSRANRGIYQSGPWSDSLKATFVKVDGKGGAASEMADRNGGKRVREREIIGNAMGGKGGSKIRDLPDGQMTPAQMKSITESLRSAGNMKRFNDIKNDYLSGNEADKQDIRGFLREQIQDRNRAPKTDRDIYNSMPSPLLKKPLNVPIKNYGVDPNIFSRNPLDFEPHSTASPRGPQKASVVKPKMPQIKNKRSQVI